ncbi:MAG: 4Fe-4S dicluster domain-containing protein [candidate division Zixibacteria bacterium]|nr:4Fe-4S dicluster domain-containing protein [candidate division Zixibacteria bacterium]
MGFIKQVFSGIYNLVAGLFVTGKHLGRHAITLQYPKERWEMPERSRGVVVLLSNLETGKLNCTACLLCMKACPTGAIIIDREKNPDTKRWEPTKFVIDNTICAFCGLCEESCNFDAIKLTGKYEFSVFDQAELIYDLDRLAELGRDVKYTPRKKPAAKKKAAQQKPPASAKKPDEKKAEKAEDKPGEEKPEARAAEKPANKPENKAEEKAESKPDEKPEEKPAPKQAEKPVENKEKAEAADNKPEEKKSEKPDEPKQENLDLDKEKDKKDSGN